MPNAEIADTQTGAGLLRADHVCSLAYRVEGSVIDFRREFKGVIDFDAELASGTHNLRMPKEVLNRPKVASSPVDPHRHEFINLCARN